MYCVEIMPTLMILEKNLSRRGVTFATIGPKNKEVDKDTTIWNKSDL